MGFKIGKLVPSLLRAIFRINRVLLVDHGLYRSMACGQSVGKDGSPLPWISFPAISYLQSLDLTGLRVFEYGCGNSTAYWSKRGCRTIAVESHRGWYEAMVAKKIENAEIIYAPPTDLESYINCILEQDGDFDIVLVDGLRRSECALQAVTKLSKKGILILDNADWYPTARKVLRNCGLIQIDFFGFSPIFAFPTLTSIYFSREFDLKPSVVPAWLPGSHADNHEHHLV